MSSKKSVFSPIRLNISSPISIKSPAKDYGINERIETGREKVVAGYDRWKLASLNGFHCASKIHSIKEKARRSGEGPYPTELETFCKKLEIIKTVFEDVIKSIADFNREIISSMKTLESIKDNEELRLKTVKIRNFLDALIKVYESSLKLRLLIIENIAHTTSSHQSELLINSWHYDPNQNELFKLITQLKISPNEHQWIVS